MRIDRDKKLHLIAGVAVAVPCSVLAAYLGLTLPASFAAGCAAGWVAGILKELYDHIKNELYRRRGLLPVHSVDPADVVWTAAGGVIGGLTAIALMISGR